MYLLWALINTTFTLLFFGLVLTLFTKGKQLFNNKYGNTIIVVFAVGIIGILSAKDRDFNNTYIFPQAKGVKGHSVASYSAKLEESITITLHLNVSFKKNENGELVPSRSRSNLSGFTNGYKWKHNYTDIDTQKNGTHHYEMSGVLYWYLFGIEIYSQHKTFTGTLE